MNESTPPRKRKRKPGPRPKAEHYVSFSITMSPTDVQRLEEQQRVTGHSRSELLRRVWRGLPLSPRIRHGLETVKFYRELITLAGSLQKLSGTAQYGPAAQALAEHLLDQLTHLLTQLNEGVTQ